MASEFVFIAPKRSPFLLNRPELLIGSDEPCTLRLECAGVAAAHARVTLDANGVVFVQDLDTRSGTLHNGEFIYQKQRLADGDRITLGTATMIFRAKARPRVAAATTPYLHTVLGHQAPPPARPPSSAPIGDRDGVPVYTVTAQPAPLPDPYWPSASGGSAPLKLPEAQPWSAPERPEVVLPRLVRLRTWLVRLFGVEGF